MNNSEIADMLKLTADLMELHDGNPFKIKSYAAASFRIDKISEPLFGQSLESLSSVEGIGKGIAQKLHELFISGHFPELEELLEKTPQGIREIMRIKGIGPKKVAVIWKELGVENVGELLYACKENRLAQLKGFGLKTQASVIQQIAFMYASANKLHYASVYELAHEVLKKTRSVPQVERAEFTGDFRRKMEVVSEVEIMIATQADNLPDPLLPEQDAEGKIGGCRFIFHKCTPENFAVEWFKHSGNPAHVDEVFSKINIGSNQIASEEELYTQAGLAFIEPELRENLGELEMARNGSLPKLIEFGDLQGALHNHSTWSDGLHDIATMAEYCQQKGYSYLGMADHSKSAFYANGLNEERVYQQQQEIKGLNQKYGNTFKVFAGIECDILYDGNLDYDNEVLKSFDYVVASVHSVLKMTEEKAMERLIKAIENPYTTILGHPTGRLLLMREGYPIQAKKLIDACAANGVIMELNANPYRLDLDWRHIAYALEKGVWISINPDAHEVTGFHDMFYGVEVARKGGLSAAQCFNAQSTEFVARHFAQKKA